MDAEYFRGIFDSFQEALRRESGQLPSVSQLALENKGDPYAVLISTVISLRTKDQVTIEASRRLLSRAGDPEKMLSLTKEEIQALIYPCGFYKRKAVQILDISKALMERFDGAVPSTQEELLSLPGVGIKTANLTLNLGFGIKAICVDCHVHQIANRLGWIETERAEESVSALEAIMPKEFWIPLNELLVAYGQTICTPLSPFCSKCPQEQRCAKRGVSKSR